MPWISLPVILLKLMVKIQEMLAQTKSYLKMMLPIQCRMLQLFRFQLYQCSNKGKGLVDGLTRVLHGHNPSGLVGKERDNRDNQWDNPWDRTLVSGLVMHQCSILCSS